MICHFPTITFSKMFSKFPHSWLENALNSPKARRFRCSEAHCSTREWTILVIRYSDVFRFPNVTVGVLTRDSIRTALRSGITADQIVGFLRMHAHPKMMTGGPVLPPTVVDQIYLWEQERNRFVFSEGVLYSNFISQSDFETLRDYAQDLGVLVWQNDRKRTMVRNIFQ